MGALFCGFASMKNELYCEKTPKGMKFIGWSWVTNSFNTITVCAAHLLYRMSTTIATSRITAVATLSPFIWFCWGEWELVA